MKKGPNWLLWVFCVLPLLLSWAQSYFAARNDLAVAQHYNERSLKEHESFELYSELSGLYRRIAEINTANSHNIAMTILSLLLIRVFIFKGYEDRLRHLEELTGRGLKSLSDKVDPSP